MKMKVKYLVGMVIAAMVAFATVTVNAAVFVKEKATVVLREVLRPIETYVLGYLVFWAIVNTKSTAVTNRDSTPAVINDGRIERSDLRTGIGSVAVGAADSATSYYPLVTVPSTAMVRAVLATSVTGMTTLAGDIGVYKNTVNSAGVTTGVAANTGSGSIFAAAFSFATLKERAEATNTGTTYPTDKREQPLWQAIGLAADPGGTFDIGVKVTTANTGAAGRLGLEVQYVDNGS